MDLKKTQLAEALKEEFDRLSNHSNFNLKKEKREYDLAIKYLETGEHPKYYNDNDLLYTCIEDFEQMYSDYTL